LSYNNQSIYKMKNHLQKMNFSLLRDFQKGRLINTLLLSAFMFLSSQMLLAQYVVNFDGAGETKTGYASGTVNLSGLNWNMTEALIGTEAAEIINGIRTARLRGYGTSSFTMLQNKANGAGTISFNYRQYGADAQVAWRVEYSTNDGGSWTQVGSDFTATASVLNFSEVVNVSGNIRFRIESVPTTGTANRRMNIDDITISDYVVSGPTIIANVGSLVDFSYTEGSGPSAWQLFTIRGADLTADITSTTGIDFEFSLDNASFSASLGDLIETAGIVDTTAIYVRLAAGRSAGLYSESITFSSTGATDVVINLDGEVIASCLTADDATDFVATAGDAEATLDWTNGICYDEYLVVGREGSAVSATPSGNGSGYFANTLFSLGTDIGSEEYVVYKGTGTTATVVALTNGETYHFTIFGRLGTNWSAGVSVSATPNEPETPCATEDFQNMPANNASYLSRSWTGTDGVTWTAEGARTDRTLNGRAITFGVTANDPRHVTSPVYADGMGTLTFNYVRDFTGTGARSIQVWVNGIQIGGDITVSATSDDVVLYSNDINIGGNVQLEIRSVGASQVKIDDISWTCFDGPGSPMIIANPLSVSDMNYQQGEGPSASQIFTVSGSNLIGDISATLATNFEFSIDDVTYSSSLADLAEVAGEVAETTVYVRLIEGLGVGSYNAELTLSSTGAGDVVVSFSGAVTPAPAPPCSELFISEYIEGSSNNKYIEIYNPTSSSVDLTDYALVVYSNGSPTVSSTLNLVGTITPYSVFVVAHTSATIYGGTPDQTVNGGALGFNGDDAVALRKDGLNIDVIGQIGVDPGTGWTGGGCSTENRTLVRKAGITTGDINGADAFDPSIEWDCFDVDDVTNLGAHTSECGPTCVAPTVNLNIEDDCVAGTFQIFIEIENNGDASGYVIVQTVNNGAPIVTGPFQTGPSSYFTIRGPFNFGDEVDLTFEHADNSACDQSFNGLTSLGDCAPVNNDCANATPITPVSPNVNYGMGLYAQANSIGTVWGATASGTGSCGAGTDVFYSLNVPYLNHYIVSVNPFGGADVALEILDACGGSQLSCTDAAGAAGIETAYLISLAAGDYTIRVSGSAASSSVGQFLLNVQAAPTTRIMDGTGCNESDLQLEDVIRCNLVSTALDYEWRFVEVGGGLDASFMRSSLSNAGSTNNRNLRLSWVPGIDYNKLYNVYVRAQFDIPGYGVVWGAYREFATDLTMLGASECTVETGTSVTPTQLRPEYSPNNPVSGLPHTFCNGLVATWVGQAEQFQWELDGPTFHEVTSPSYFVNLGSIAGLQAGQVYQVRVRARVNGLWGSYGVQLPVSIGLPSNTQVLGYLCGTTRALNQAIAAVNTCGASSYTFRFQHATEAERIIVRPAYTCPLWLVTPALTPGETYSVTVKVAQGGVDGDYSTACDITIAGPQAEGLADDMMVSKVATEGGMGIYPNPNTGSEVRVELNGIEDGAHNVEVTIYDIYGKLMTRDVFGHQGSQLSRLVRFETELATGMYLVHVTIDGNIFATEKLIVK
jgi:hypothetical protein